MAAGTTELTKGEYDHITSLVYSKSGINLGDHKIQLVRARLGKLVRQGGFSSFKTYLDHVERDSTGEELCVLLDAISTNTTHLFREERHFSLLAEVLREWLGNKAWRAANPTLRIWSAACSSGEEPHSLSMVVDDVVRKHRGIDAKILATDLSTQMLSRAKLAIYEPHRVGTIPNEYKNRYLKKVRHEEENLVQLVPGLRRMITFSRFNLMSPTFPFRQGFNIIFCRNVMIYFDRATQSTLINKMACHMRKGAFLMIGHSESLSNIDHPLEYVEPTVYRKR